MARQLSPATRSIIEHLPQNPEALSPESWALLSQVLRSWVDDESTACEDRLDWQLQQHKILLDSILEADPSGLAVVVGPELHFVYVNPAYRFICPDPEVEFIDQPYERIWSADMANSYHDQIMEVVQTGRPFLVTGFERTYADGASRVFTLQARRIAWGSQSAALLILWDTTGAHRAELILREGEERFRSFFDLSPDPIFVQSNRRFFYANRAALRLFGADRPEQLLGKKVLDLTHPDYRQLIAERMKMVNDQRLHVEMVEEVFLRLDGSCVECEVVAAPYDFAGQSGAIVIARELTERRRAEKATQQQSRIVNAVNQILDEAIHSADDEQLGRACLKIIGMITGSQYGFIGEIGADGLIHHLAIDDPGWEACSMIEQNGRPQPMSNYKIQGIYEQVLSSGRSLIANDLATHPQRISLPGGHPPITSFLGVPLWRQSKIIGILALANRPAGYGLEEQETMEALAPVIVEALDRVREAQAIHEKEEKFRTTLGSIGDAVITTDAQGCVTFLNPVAERLTGWGNDEAAGRSLNKVFPIVNEFTGEPIENPVSRVIENGMVVGLANHIALIARDGHSIPIEDSAAPIRDSAGQVVGVVIVFHDVSDRRRAEHALRESEMRFHALADNIPQLAWMADASGGRFWFNQRWFDYTGTTLEEMRGDGWQKVHHPDYVQNVLNKIQEHFSLGKPWEETFLLRGRDGNYRWFLSRAVPILDEQGQVLRWFGTNTDITEFKSSEEERRKTIMGLEQSPATIVITDKWGTIEYVNPKFCELTGYSREEAIGQNPRILKTGHTTPDEYARLWHTIRSGQVWHGEFCNRKKNGETYWEMASISPVFDEQGAISHFVAVKEDITERKSKELQLQKLNRTLKALTESSQAMLHAQDEASYLADICRIITESCGYAMVWIGYAENDPEKTVRPVAYAGIEPGFFDTLHITWADNGGGDGPTGKAIRTGQLGAYRNLQTDPACLPWREKAAKRGYTASVALPLLGGSQVFGAITIYSRDPDPFSEEEIQLLSELASDLAYGITTLRIREARQRAEAEIRQQQEWLRVTLSSIGDAVISVDTSGRIRFINPVAEQLTGWSQDEVVGRSIQQVFNIINEKTGEPARDVVGQAMAEKRVVALANHTVLVTKDGRRVPIEDSAAPILDAGGSLAGVVMVFHDVTEKRRAQEALRESEERLSLAIEGAGMATWDLDLPTGHTVWSRRMFELLGYPPAHAGEARMEMWYDRVYPEDLESMLAAIERARHDHRLFHSEHRITRADNGQVAWLRVFGRFTYDQSGEPLRFLGVLFDDTPFQQAARFIAAQVAAGRTPVEGPQGGARYSGIEVIGSVPWGTHFCQFYQTSQDLVDILVPYFRAGLEANEYCMWVTSPPLDKEQTLNALSQSAPDLLRYIVTGQLEILDYREWYVRDGVFNADTVLQGWTDRLAAARQKGFEGLRLTGNTFWLEASHWEDFTNYEEKINAVIGEQRMIALCTYSLDKCGVGEIMDVLANHQFALIKKTGKWEIIESSEHKKTERALRESEERLRLAIWAADLGVFEWDVINDFAIWENQRMYEIFGRNPLEGPISKAQLMAEFIHPDDVSTLEEAIREGVKPGHLFHTICRIQRQNDGELRWIEYNGRFVRNPQGDPVLLKGMIGDITERKQREEALRESEEHYRRLFTAITEGFSLHEIICDVDGRPIDYRFLDVNPAFEQITGLKRSQVIGRTVLEVLPNTEPTWIDRFGHVALTGEPVHFQNYSKELGKYFDVVAFSPEKGQFASIIIDITERKQLEEEARQRAAHVEVQRLLIEQREQERLQIARDLHDGPVQELTAASFTLQSVRMDCKDAHLNAVLEELSKSIQNQIGEMRAYAAELRPPTISRFGLEKAMRSHLEMFQEKYPHLRVIYDAYQNGDLVSQNQRLALFRICQQALNNVVKHARASEVRVSLRKNDQCIRIEITDDGRGFTVPDDFLEIARQGHLGLVGIRERAEAIGGTAQIISEPGKGTTVRVVVPLVEE